jgi:hemerythrin-like domain-containing protein
VLSLDAFVVLARDYVAIQRKHAAWEDERLLPLAEEFLNDHDDSRMLAAFRRIEARRPNVGPGEVSAFVEKLCERFEVDRAPASASLLEL